MQANVKFSASLPFSGVGITFDYPSVLLNNCNRKFDIMRFILEHMNDTKTEALGEVRWLNKPYEEHMQFGTKFWFINDFSLFLRSPGLAIFASGEVIST